MNKEKALLNALTIISVIESGYNVDNEILTSFTNYGTLLVVSFGCKSYNSYVIKSIIKDLMDEEASIDMHWNEKTQREYIEIRWDI